MKVTIDKEECIGCGLCATICEDVFEMADDKATVTVDLVPADLETDVQDAVDSCPVSVIFAE